MKQIILFALICLVTFTATSQLVQEDYTWDNTLQTTHIEDEELVFSFDINENDTPKSSILEVRLTNTGETISTIKYIILNSYILNETITYEVQLPNGALMNILFWIPQEEYVPMVVQEFKDGYIIFHGNVNY